jgi:hypothetical protein
LATLVRGPMAEFKTGRTRTISVEWTLGGTAHVEYVELTFPTAAPVHLQLAKYTCNFFGFTLIAWNGFETDDTSDGGYLEPEDFRTLKFSHVLIATDWDFSVVGADGPPYDVGFGAGEGPYTQDLDGGTASVTFDVEEWCVTELMDPDADPASLVNGSPFPTMGGGAYADNIPGVKVAYVERPAEGNTATATISVGGANVSHSLSLPTTVNVSYPVYCAVLAAAQASTASFTNHAEFNGDGLGHSYSPSDGTHSVDGEAGSAIATESSGTLGAFASTELRSSVSPKISYELSARLRAQDSAYPDSLDATWICKATPETVTLAPSGSASLDQLDYELVAFFDGSPKVGVALHEQGYTYAYLNPAGGEDTRDWRMQISGTSWDAATLSYSEYTLPGSTLSGDVTYSLPVDEDDRPFHGTRFLRIVAHADEPKTLTVTLAGRSWTVDITDTSATYDLDLCRATDETEEERYKDTRFPLDPAGDIGFPVAGHPEELYALGWGVEWADSIGLSVPGAVEDGAELVVASVALVSTDRQRLTLLTPFARLTDGWESETDVTTLQRHALLEVDGRVADWPGAALVSPFSADPYWRMFSIEELAQMMDYGPNWASAALDGPGDDYHGPGLPAYLLGGGGATVDQDTGDWIDWYDKTSFGTIPAQDLWDLVYVFPGAGEVWTAGDYDERTKLRISKSLRAQGTGLLYDDATGASDTGATAELRKVSGNVFRGDDATDSIGYYATGTPWGQGFAPHKLLRPGADGPVFPIANRMRHRATLGPGEQGKVLALVSRPDGRLYRLTAAASSTKFGRASVGDYTTWTAESIYDPADSGDLAILPRDKVAVLLIVDGVAKLALVEDEGQTEVTTMDDGDATDGSLVSRGDGTVYVFRIDGGTVKGSLRSAFDLSLVDGPWDTNLTGLSDDAKVRTVPVRQAGNVPAIVLSTFDGTTTTYLSTDAKTFV